MPDLIDIARAWAADDPDPATRREIEDWISSGDLRAFEGAPLRFGTSGLRGPLRPGPAGMNRRVARLVAAGLAARVGAGSVVVGRDARHGSSALAADIAAVLAGAGLPVRAFAEPVPTPVLAFAVRRLGCEAGIMVTASHNPPGDNGIKVYAADGAQITAPADADIAAAMAQVRSVRGLPLGIPEVLDGEVLASYVAAAAERVPPGPRAVRVVYTPLHGVAGDAVTSLFERSGFDRPHVVASQARPDPDFPTVTSPNPEEPGALDLACAEGTALDADVVLATDPDGDRLGVLVPGADGWRKLTGDEIGALLAEQALRTTAGADRVVATSLVSSSLVARLADEHGARCLVTPTGFKWIARGADDVPNGRLVFAYEEALGYAVHDLVKDKDGITAAVAFAALVAELLAAGSSVPERLDQLARRHGLHASRQWSVRATPASIEDAMRRLDRDPPHHLAGRAVLSVERPMPGTLVLELEGDARVLVRPSGTEPKLKRYFQLVIDPVDDVDAARAAAAQTLDALRADLDHILDLRA